MTDDEKQAEQDAKREMHDSELFDEFDDSFEKVTNGQVDFWLLGGESYGREYLRNRNGRTK